MVESEVCSLECRVDELKAIILESEESSSKQIEKIKTLESEIGNCRGILDNERDKVEDLIREKTVLLEDKGIVDSEVNSLKIHVDELKAIILDLEDSSANKTEKIQSLESEIGKYEGILEQLKLESDEIKNGWDKEKQNAAILKETIQAKENKIEEHLRAAEEVKAKSVSIQADKKDLERQCQMLKKEISDLESMLNHSRSEFDSMKNKVELAISNSELDRNLFRKQQPFVRRMKKMQEMMIDMELKRLIVKKQGHML